MKAARSPVLEGSHLPRWSWDEVLDRDEVRPSLGTWPETSEGHWAPRGSEHQTVLGALGQCPLSTLPG